MKRKKKTKRSKPWQKVHMVAVILTKPSRNNEKVLMGMKTDGALVGFLNFPGGHIEEGETPLQASYRECGEETGYEAKVLACIAKVSIWREAENKHVVVDIYHTSKFSGHLTVDTTEFEYLKFFAFNAMPWDMMAPGEKEWVEKLLRKRSLWGFKVLRATIRCGKNRKDVLSVSTRYTID